MTKKRYIIIGDGAAGTTAAQTLRLHDPTATIAILTDDPHAAYFRSALTNYLLGELREEQIWAVPPSFYDELSIHRVLVRVAQVDAKRSLVWLGQGGRPIPYDALVVASGSRARPPAFEGHWLPGVMTMRTLLDVHRVMDLIKTKGVRTAVVVGGGPLALEWAHGLSHRGVKVMMVVRDAKFLPGAIDGVASDLLLARLRHAGVQVRMSDEVVAATAGPQGRVSGVVLKSGERVACDLVAAAIGVVCNSEFLNGSGVEVAKNGGVVVDDRMRSNVENVYAAGDVAAYKGKLLQLWEPARMQARVAAGTIQGRNETYAPGVHYMATRLYDLDCASLGDVGAGAKSPDGTEEIVDFPQRTGRLSYRKLRVKDDRVIGALMFGEREARVRRFGRALKKLIDTKTSIAPIRGELLDPAFDLSAWIHTNAIVEKPKQVRPLTLASAAEMKGTHAINLADLPPLPGIGAKAAAPAPTAPAQGTQALQAFGELLPPPVVALEGPPGRIPVFPPSAILGSDPQLPIPLRDPLVSFRHAELTIAGQAVYLRDLGSQTGTWLNGTAISAPKTVRDGDRLRIGGTELVIRVQTSDGSGRMSQAVPSVEKTGEPKPHLEVRTGRSLGLAFELVEDMITIGRDPTSTIRLDDESIDARHAWLRKTPAGWDVADAESHGITKKNGALLGANQWAPLAPGDVVEVGEVALVYAIRAPTVLAGLLAPASVSYGAYGAPSVDPRVSHAPVSHQPVSHPHAVSQAPYTPRSPGVAPFSGPRGRLSVRQGPGLGNVAELGDVTVIGSHHGQANLVVPDPQLAPRHVELTRTADGFYARDLGAPSGTSCRGHRLGPVPFKLQNGDVLVLGQSVALLFEASA